MHRLYIHRKCGMKWCFIHKILECINTESWDKCLNRSFPISYLYKDHLCILTFKISKCNKQKSPILDFYHLTFLICPLKHG